MLRHAASVARRLPALSVSGARGACRPSASPQQKRWLCLGLDSKAPQELRRPFQQTNRKRDDKLLPRMAPAVPQDGEPLMQAWISSFEEPHIGIAQIRADVWGMPLRTDIVHRVVTWQRACARAGTHKQKHRHEVRGGGRKPRPQKGLGKSRQGSIRSPLWVGGGRAFPKTPADYSYKLNQKVVTLGIKTALSDKYARGALLLLRDFELPHQNALHGALGRLGINIGEHRPLVILPYGTERAEVRNMQIAADKMARTSWRVPSGVTTLDLVTHSVLILSLESLEQLERRFAWDRTSGFVDARLTEAGGAETQAGAAADAAAGS